MSYLDDVFKQTADGGYFDFARCQRADGSFYGTGGTCRSGDKVGAREVDPSKKSAAPVKAAKAKLGGVKVGTEKALMALTSSQLKQLREDPRLYDYQKAKIDAVIAKKGGDAASSVKPSAKPASSAKPEPKPAAKAKPGEMETIPKVPSKISDEKLEASFNRSVERLNKLTAEADALRKEGASYDDPRLRVLSRQIGRAEYSANLARQAYHAVDRDRFLRAVGEEEVVSKKLTKAAQDIQKYQAGPDRDEVKRDEAYARQRELQREIRPFTDAVNAAYFGEPAKTTMKSDGGGSVSSNVPSTLPRGGADPKLKEFMDSSTIVMQRSPRGLARMVESGEVLNAFQTGRSGIGGAGKGYMDNRREGERIALGIPKDARPEERPIYAAIDNPDRTRALGCTGLMTQYGGVSVVLKPDVKDRSSFTLGDSLDDISTRGMQASPMRDPAPVKGEIARYNQTVGARVNGNGSNSRDYELVTTGSYGGPESAYRPPYMEAQVYGGLKMSDVQEVRVYEGHKVSNKTVKALQEQGIRVIQLPPQMSNVSLTRDDDGFGDIRSINTKA